MGDAFLLGDALGGAKGLERCRRDILEFVAGKETTKVEWGVGEMIVDEPATHLTDHGEVVVNSRDDEVGDLDPDACIAHGEDGVEDGLQMAATDTMVDVVAEGFQVDVGGIEVGQ